MSLLRLLGVLSAVAASALAQTTYLEPAQPGSAEASVRGSLEVARNGSEVVLGWTLPEGEIRLLEIYRHTARDANGRVRIAGLRTHVRNYVDVLPDAAATYWYWIKLTRPDGALVNIGPVPTPSGQVWRPEEAARP